MEGSTQQLEHLGRDWANAELRGDATFLRSTLTDDFVAVGPRGFVLAGEGWLDRHGPPVDASHPRGPDHARRIPGRPDLGLQ